MKRLLILGFILTILLAIPLTLFLVGQQTKTRSGASPATHLTFVPLNKTVNVGDSFSIDVSLDPGVSSGAPNLVTFINLQINYTSNLTLDQNAGNNNTGMIIHKVNGNDLVVLVPPSSPQCGAATCTVTVSLGVNPGQQIQIIAPSFITLFFKANAPTDQNNPTTIALTGSKVLSTGASDQPSNNVLSSADTAQITVNGPGDTPTPSETPGPGTPTDTPTPAGGVTDTPTPEGGSVTDTPTPEGGSVTDTPTPEGGVSPTGTSSATSICSSLSVDKSTGNVPLTVNFTATGNDANGSVSKVTYNFGDGKVQDVTSGGGVGTTVVNSQISHTYDTEGTFTASATVTDIGGPVSDSTNCSQTITVSAAGTTITNAPTVKPTIPPSGPGQTIVNVGIFGAILSIVGAVLIFAL